MPKKSLYHNYEDRVKALSMAGFPAYAEMTRYFTTQSDMGRALDQSGSAIGHVLTGSSSRPSKKAEQRAREWLDSAMTTAARNYGAAQPAPNVKEPSPAWIDKPAPEKAVTLMVVAPAPSADKVQKVLAMMGCEVVEI